MDTQTHSYYESHAAETVARHLACDNNRSSSNDDGSAAGANPGVAAYFRRTFNDRRRILDVGCGAGRDICELRRLGFDADGVDASPAMIRAAIAVNPNLANHLRHDSLPELNTCADEAYDGILCAAVLQHLPDHRLFDAAFAFRRILEPGGRLLISIPLPDDPTIDPETRRDPDGRLFNQVPPEKLQLLLERTGFTLHWRENTPDALNRPHRHWCTMLFELTASASAARPLQTVEGILNRDSKDATYKLALVRALAEIAQTQYAQARWTTGGQVKIPTELIARKWLEYYWPLFAASSFIPQKYGEKPDGAKRIAFRGHLSSLITASRKAGFGELPGFIGAEHSGSLPGALAQTFKNTIGKLKSTVWNMPVRYAGIGEFSVFRYDKTDQTVVMDAGLWREFSLTGSWIADACILRWSELTSQISRGELQPSQIIDLLMKTPVPDHDTSVVRAVFGDDSALRCVWSDQSLNRYEVDHAIPYALWRNNDLWNLFPAAPKVNNQKRDKLPSHRLLLKRKDCIVDYWRRTKDVYPTRFMAEANGLCGLRKMRDENWENPLFHALQEAIETTAIQRGVPRWEPTTLEFVPAQTNAEEKRTVETEPVKCTTLYFIPSLRIACGCFREDNFDPATTMQTREVEDPHGRLDPNRHFLAIAEGDSMSHGNNPINPGDLILLERIDPMHAGSISSGAPLAVEYRDPATGEVCYALKNVRKSNGGGGGYILTSNNRAYAPIQIDPDSFFPFARLLRKICD